MKPVAFDYRRPRNIEDGLGLLAATQGAKILAGGQTLGPMLNLRLARPRALIDITRIPELVRAQETSEAVLIGAGVTHAAIEDGLVPDPTDGLLRRVAAGIAYRAVRNRGTIGGSLAHADPAADWLTLLMALSADAVIRGPDGERPLPVDALVQGVFETAIGPHDILTAIRIPRADEGVRLGFYKYCRKAGDFAEAMAAVSIDRARGTFRLVSGAGESPPILIRDPAHVSRDGALEAPDDFDLETAIASLRQQRASESGHAIRLHAVALRRAIEDALSR